MFKSIKLNKDYWKKRIPYLKFGTPDPRLIFSDDVLRFSEAMTSFRFNQVYKTTKTNRHLHTQNFLKNYFGQENKPVIFDIGASDGSTSLNFIDLLNQSFKKYYVTDYNIECSYVTDKGYTFFFDQSDTCFLVASKRFVFYPETSWYVDFFFKNKLHEIINKPKTNIVLCNRKLFNLSNIDDRIKILSYNIFETWRNEKADIIIVGNLLNRSYFSDPEIKKAILNCYEALTENGVLAIIRNKLEGPDEIEKSSVYCKSDKFSLKKIFEQNGGVEINDLILSLQFK